MQRSLMLQNDAINQLPTHHDLRPARRAQRQGVRRVARQTHQIRVPAADYTKINGKHYTYSLDLLMEPGPNKISVGVVDDVSNSTGFDRVPVIAADLR